MSRISDVIDLSKHRRIRALQRPPVYRTIALASEIAELRRHYCEIDDDARAVLANYVGAAFVKLNDASKFLLDHLQMTLDERAAAGLILSLTYNADGRPELEIRAIAALVRDALEAADYEFDHDEFGGGHG